MSIPALAAGDFALALVGALFTLYLALLSLRRHHSGGANRWAATGTACAMVISVADGLQYMTANSAFSRRLSQLEALVHLVLTFALTRFAAQVVGRRHPVPGWVLTLGLAALGLLILSPATYPEASQTVQLAWHGAPFVLPASTPGGDALFGALLALNAGTVVWLVTGVKDRAAAVAWGLAFGGWVAAGVVDMLTVDGAIARAPMFFMEYGQFLFALSIVAVDVRRYGALLEESEALVSRLDAGLTTLLDRVPLPAIVQRGGRFVYLNPAATALLGYASAADLIGQPVLAVVHPEDLAVARALAASPTAVPLREERIRRRDGGWVSVDLVAVPLVFRGEGAVVAMGLDVSARRELTARMMAMDRMIAVGTLAAGVAHEINNPLAFVTANLIFALEELPLVAAEQAGRLAEIHRALQDAQVGAERVRLIVRDLSSLSRAHAEERAPVDLAAALETAASIVANEIRHRARLVKDLGPTPRVLGSAARLTQVFVNLLANAAQAIPEGAAAQNEVLIRTRTGEGGQAVVEISDTGSGIAPQHRAQIFDAFFTTKPVGSGTGLGLSICQSLVRGMGGEIGFQTEVGQGTTFRLTLPPAREGAAAEAPREPPPPAARRARVLFVDDEPLVAAAMQRALRGKHEVACLSSAREALARLRAGEAYDVIFCDLMMPDFSGAQLYAALREHLPQVAARVVFITGGAFTPEAAALLASASHRALEKPLDLDAVLGAIADVTGPASGAPQT